MQLSCTTQSEAETCRPKLSRDLRRADLMVVATWADEGLVNESAD